MKTLFFEARYRGKVDPEKIDAGSLPKRIVLATTVQFLDSLDPVRKSLERRGKKVILPKGLHAAYRGQVLGCSLISSIPEAKNADCFLYIGDGLFHPRQLMLKNDLPVFVFDPKADDFRKLSVLEVDSERKRAKGALLRFLSSERIGILVSIKPGQNRMALARRLKRNLSKRGKEAYLFLSDTIDFSEFENFPFVEVWVNTACPRIAYDDQARQRRPIIDYEEVPDEYRK